MQSRSTFNALIRTHHITSQKKIAKLRAAAYSHEVCVVLRVGGTPGIMYVEGSQNGVEAWVTIVNRLRYKNYRLISKPALTHHGEAQPTGIHTCETVKEFASMMESYGLHAWWRQKMGFTSS